jgi:hypothetical protein
MRGVLRGSGAAYHLRLIADPTAGIVLVHPHPPSRLLGHAAAASSLCFTTKSFLRVHREAQAGAVVALASPKAHVAPRGKPGLGRDAYPSLS